MGGDIEMSDSACTHFHDHEDIQDTEAGRDSGEELAGQNGLCMVANEGRPTLRRRAASGSEVIRHIASDGPRREPNPGFHKQLSGEALLAPGRVLVRHFSDEFPQLDRDSGPSARLGLPPPPP